MVDRADLATGADEATASVDEDQSPEIRWPDADAPGWEAWRSFQPSSGWAGKPPAAGPAPGVAYAEFGLRAAAFAIDAGLVVLINNLVAGYAERLITGLLGYSDPVGIFTDLLAISLVTAVVLVAASAYAITVLRATPGQLAVGLVTLAGADGHVVPFRRAVVRQLVLFGPLGLIPIASALASLLVTTAFAVDIGPGLSGSNWPYWILPAAAVWYVVLALSAIRDPRGRGFHDRLADSVVVRKA